MTAVSRLGGEGYGVRRLGSFAGKTHDDGSGPHPVGIITRLSLDGYGVRRYSSFAGKTQSVEPVVVVRSTGVFGKKYPDRRHHDDEWTQEEIERVREQIKRSREQAEQARQDKLQAEQDRLAELLALYEEITGEAKPKPVKAKVSEVRRQNRRVEKQILEVLQGFSSEELTQDDLEITELMEWLN